MQDPMHRQWLLLRAIPRAPRAVDNAGLRAVLAANGYEVSSRMVHRDLTALARVFPLQVDTRSVPHGWSWTRDAPGLDVPQMDTGTALVFNLVEQHLRPLLPPSLRDLLAANFGHARRTLEAMGGGLSGKIRIVASGPPLRPPAADEGVVAVWTEALLRERRLAMTYRKAGAAEGKRVEVDPQGLVLRGAQLVLVARPVGATRPGVVHYLAHRCLAAEMLAARSAPEPGFDLARHAETGAFGWVQGEGPVAFVADFDASAAQAVLESPLGEDQTTEPLPDGRVRVSATVADSHALRGWLMGFGARVEVKSPPTLRAHFAETAAAMAARYAGAP
jgi:predicted DNA-binding transcriptional regulator YafY